MSVPVPYEELLLLLPLLDQYRRGWSEDRIWEMADKHWLNNRPCVIEEKERLAQENAVRIRVLHDAGQGITAGEQRVETISGVKYAFRWCPPGTFIMGDGGNQHEVTLPHGFWLLETPVTQLMWKSVIGTGLLAKLFGGKNPSRFIEDNLPVEEVSWNMCQDFIDK